MNRIESTFARLKGKRAALIGYFTAGFPDVRESLAIGRALLESCDLVEIGVPFSDPVMDGPVLQQTACQALEAGFRISEVFSIAAHLRGVSDKPLLLMSYVNPVFRYGYASFAKDARDSGIDGVVLPDLPPEEGEEWQQAACAQGLGVIQFASPLTPDERLRYLSSRASGFIYCIAALGTTGMRDRLDAGLQGFIRRARAFCHLPLAVGIGISNPEQCGAVGRLADGVIVGSAFMRGALEAWAQNRSAASRVAELALAMRRSLGP